MGRVDRPLARHGVAAPDFGHGGVHHSGDIGQVLDHRSGGLGQGDGGGVQGVAQVFLQAQLVGGQGQRPGRGLAMGAQTDQIVLDHVGGAAQLALHPVQPSGVHVRVAGLGGLHPVGQAGQGGQGTQGLVGGVFQMAGVAAQLDGDDAQGLADFPQTIAAQAAVDRHLLDVAFDLLDGVHPSGQGLDRRDGLAADALGVGHGRCDVINQQTGPTQTDLEVAQVAPAVGQAVNDHDLFGVLGHAGQAVDDLGRFGLEIGGDVRHLVGDHVQQAAFGPVARLGRQVRLANRAGRDLDAQLDVFDPLAGDVPDLQGHQGLADLHLDVARDGGDRGGDLGDAGVVHAERLGVERQLVRHRRNQLLVLAAQPLFEGQGAVQLACEPRKLLGQLIQLRHAEVQLFTHPLGEAGELVCGPDGRAGRDLHVQGEGAQIAQRGAHHVYIGLQQGAGGLQLIQIRHPPFLRKGQGVQAFRRRQQLVAGVRNGFDVQRQAQPVERLDQPADHFERSGQAFARVGKTALDQGARRLELIRDVRSDDGREEGGGGINA